MACAEDPAALLLQGGSSRASPLLPFIVAACCGNGGLHAAARPRRASLPANTRPLHLEKDSFLGAAPATARSTSGGRVGPLAGLNGPRLASLDKVEVGRAATSGASLRGGPVLAAGAQCGQRPRSTSGPLGVHAPGSGSCPRPHFRTRAAAGPRAPLRYEPPPKQQQQKTAAPGVFVRGLLLLPKKKKKKKELRGQSNSQLN